MWNISPISCFNHFDNKSYKHAFRSLSTIIVDSNNIIKYSENMIPFELNENEKTFTVDNNYPTYKQINLTDTTPNIILIVLESFIAKNCNFLNPNLKENITPFLSTLSKKILLI